MTSTAVTFDTSVAVAAFATWHDQHDLAVAALAGREVLLIAHVGFESVSTLSRMPEGLRVDADAVLEWLERRCPAAWLSLGSTAVRAALGRAVDAGIAGGALYDAVIGLTAREHGLTLLTDDARARPTYAALGVSVEYLRP